jgi:sialidase-1
VNRSISILILAGLLLLSSRNGNGQKSADQVLWRQGSGAYKNYRIPAVIISSKGTLLAFCEGREGGDSGDIDILMKSSHDGGKTWSDEKVIWNDGRNSCGNPCPVTDQATGRIILMMTWNNGQDSEAEIISRKSKETRMPYLCYSDDDGVSWSVPEKIENAKDPSWGWYATGPGIGIQLRSGHYKGRLIVPANHSYDDPEGIISKGPFSYGAHVLISDDHGSTWHVSKPIKPGCNESQVTELTGGRLLMNMRSYNKKYCRAISESNDGGESWSEIRHDLQLVEPVCQGSIIRSSYRGSTIHLFSNPAVPSGRTHMTIKCSFDDCTSWTNSKLVFKGPSAYSCLVPLPGDYTGILFECGEKDSAACLRFIRFRTSELFLPGQLINE